MRKYTLDFKCDQNSHTSEYCVDMEIMNQHLTPSLTGGKTVGIVEQEGRVDTQKKTIQHMKSISDGPGCCLCIYTKAHECVCEHNIGRQDLKKETKLLQNKDQQQECNQVKYTDYKRLFEK